MENAWQYSKVYPEFADAKGNPTNAYWTWAQYGWNRSTPCRYPMGKGAKPLYTYWDGRKLDYLTARREVYCPLYSQAVEDTDAYARLSAMYEDGDDLWLWDFDGYDHHALGMSFEDVLNCQNRKFGHSFVLAMMLTGERVWEKDGPRSLSA